MKKLATIITIVLMFVSASAFASREPLVEVEKISEVINEYYPDLKDYYEAGVSDVASLTSETLADGTMEYNIRYRFIRNFYEGEELTKVLKEQYPDIYALKRAGLVKDVVVYKFVDKNTGQIFNQIAYNWSELVLRARARMHRR